MLTAPKALPIGRRILIPRSERGYERWAAELEKLSLQVESDADRIGLDLDAIEHTKAAQDVLWNLAGDTLTAAATGFYKAGQAARAVHAAAAPKTYGDAVVHSLRFSAAAIDDCADEMLTVGQVVSSTVKARGKSWGTDVAAQGIKAVAERAGGSAGAAMKGTLAAAQTVQAVAKGKAAWTSGSRMALLDAAGDLLNTTLDYLDVLKVSYATEKLVGLLYGGETFAATVGGERQRLHASMQRQLGVLRAKIQSVQAEKALVWGGGPD